MNNILPVKVGDAFHKAFLQNGFYRHNMSFSPLHSHNYSEIHMIASGSVKFFIKDREYIMDSGSILIIPQKTYHQVSSSEPDVLHCAFQLEYEKASFHVQKITPQILSDLMTEINSAFKNNDYSRVSPYLSLVCSKLLVNKECAIPNTDYGFLIYEFFSNHYNEDIRVSDLAKELSLSEKQTQRLVKKYIGKTFWQAVTDKRMAMADNIMKNSLLSKTNISQNVGYRSYGGFWKAYKKYKEEENCF